VGGFNVTTLGGERLRQNYALVGRVPNGAILERAAEEVALQPDQPVELLLKEPNYTTASRIADAVNAVAPSVQPLAQAMDASIVQISFPPGLSQPFELVQFVASGSHRFHLPVDFGWERPAWAGDWRQAGGLIVEMGIHGINQFRWLADSPIVSISAEHGNRRFPELPHFHDHCAVLLRAADGAQGIIQSTWLTPDAEPSHGRNATFVFGTKGYVEAIGSGIAHGLQARGGRAHASVTTDDAPPRPFQPDPGPGRSAAEDFLTQILTGRQPLVGKDFLLETVRAALLARDAAERHETIHVEPRH